MFGPREQCVAWTNRTFVGILFVVVTTATAGVVTVLVRGPQAAHSAVTSSTTSSGASRAAGVNGRNAAIERGDSPVRVRIPVIGVNAPLVPLAVDTAGTLDVPSYDDAGWYAGGTRPGDSGPAVIAAHVDSRIGPAVFHRLDELEPGDMVVVEYRDVTVSFVVRDAQQVDKSDFPTQRVYGPTDAPELRLVTCAGAFDRKTRSYKANLIVWADLLPPP